MTPLTNQVIYGLNLAFKNTVYTRVDVILGTLEIIKSTLYTISDFVSFKTGKKKKQLIQMNITRVCGNNSILMMRDDMRAFFTSVLNPIACIVDVSYKNGIFNQSVSGPSLVLSCVLNHIAECKCVVGDLWLTAVHSPHDPEGWSSDLIKRLPACDHLP